MYLSRCTVVLWTAVAPQEQRKVYGGEYIYAAQKEVGHVVASFCVHKNEYLEPYKHWYVIPSL